MRVVSGLAAMRNKEKLKMTFKRLAVAFGLAGALALAAASPTLAKTKHKKAPPAGAAETVEPGLAYGAHTGASERNVLGARRRWRLGSGWRLGGLRQVSGQRSHRLSVWRIGRCGGTFGATDRRVPLDPRLDHDGLRISGASNCASACIPVTGRLVPSAEKSPSPPSAASSSL